MADLKHAQEVQLGENNGSVELGPALFAGADADVVKAASDAIVERAQFLIRIGDNGELSSTPRQVTPRSTPRPSFQARKQWSLLVKASSKVAKSPVIKKEKRGSWGDLTKELVSRDKIKSIVSHKRKAAEKRKATMSITEKVLNFVQSRVEVTQLEQLNALRNKRASLRARGFEIMAGAIDTSRSLPFSLTWIASTIATAMRGTTDAELFTKVHYTNAVEGCSPFQQNELMTSFSMFVDTLLVALERAFNMSIVAKETNLSHVERSAWKEAILACLRALAFDYDTSDHGFLDKSDVLSLLDKLIVCPDADISRVADILFEVLVARFVGTQTIDSGEDSPNFMRQLVDRLTQRVRNASIAYEVIEGSKQLPEGALKAPGSEVTVFEGVKVLRKGSSGYSHPHIPLGLSHTISAWVKRPPSNIIDVDAAAQKISIGSMVVRGPDWAKGNADDGGVGFTGRVIAIKPTSDDGVTEYEVLWPTGKKGVYKRAPRGGGHPTSAAGSAAPVEPPPLPDSFSVEPHHPHPLLRSTRNSGWSCDGRRVPGL